VTNVGKKLGVVIQLFREKVEAKRLKTGERDTPKAKTNNPIERFLGQPVLCDALLLWEKIKSHRLW